MKIKVGLITQAGGAHLDLYFHALAKVDEVASVAIADPDGEAEVIAKENLGSKLGRVYLNFQEMLAVERPTMALVSVESKLGPAIISAALASGCHVLAEKPACVTAAEFEKLVAEADRRKLLLMLALANRVNPEIVEALRLIDDGKLGKIYGLEMHMIQDQTRLTKPEYQQSWFADKRRAGGGHLAWLGVHWLDIAMFLTRSKITQVTGFSGNVGGLPLNIEDAAVVAMRFDNGAIGTLTSGYYLDRGYQSQIKIWGSTGWLTMRSDDAEALRWYSSSSDSAGSLENFVPPKDFDAYVEFVRAAVRASGGLQKPPITATESLNALKAVYALYEAAESGRVQALD